jgi:hypothetical protein
LFPSQLSISGKVSNDNAKSTAIRSLDYLRHLDPEWGITRTYAANGPRSAPGLAYRGRDNGPLDELHLLSWESRRNRDLFWHGTNICIKLQGTLKRKVRTVVDIKGRGTLV